MKQTQLIDFLKEKRRLHFAGIGGISMSSLAMIAKRMGHSVTGSDRSENKTVVLLKEQGIPVAIGHAPDNLGDAEAVIYTAALSKEVPELRAAEAKGLPLIPRSVFLGALMSAYPHRVGVSGTHGKSTTTAMIAHILLSLGRDPTVVSGAATACLKGAYRIGGNDCFVYEACEYKAAFLDFHPTVAVVTNTELDHTDFYPSLNAVTAAFSASIREASVVVANADDPAAEAVLWEDFGLPPYGKPYGKQNGKPYGKSNGSSYGKPYDNGGEGKGQEGRSEKQLLLFSLETPQADLYGHGFCATQEGIRFTLTVKDDPAWYARLGETWGSPWHKAWDNGQPAKKTPEGGRDLTVSLPVPGRFNAANALAAIAACMALGVDPAESVTALADFRPAARRLEKKYQKEVTLYDDYAHHPSEIRATLSALKSENRRLLVAFQPHTYSRTRDLFNDFAAALRLADKLYLAPIYAAREPADPSVTSKRLAAAIPGAQAFDSLEAIASVMLDDARPGDILLTMGAGDIERLSTLLANRLLLRNGQPPRGKR